MAKDPVCGMEVYEKKFRTTYKGRNYQFCAAGCKAAFLENPKEYVRAEKELKKPARNKPRKSNLSKCLVIALAIVLFVGAWVYTKSPSRSSSREPKASSSYVRRETRIPLTPALFVGKTATAYQVAQEIPDILDQLYCYCECDRHMGHITLLSCFVDSHAAT